MYVFRFLLSFQLVAGVLVPFFMEWGQLTFFQIMLLQSWFMVWIVILEIPTGALADHIGRKPVLVLAALANTAGVILYASAQDIYIFLLAEFLWAFALALLSGADESMLYDSLKAMRKDKLSKKILGRYYSAEVLGIVAAAPLGSIIAAAFGVRWPMMLMGIPFAAAFLIALTLHEPVIRRKMPGYIQTLKKGVRYFYSHGVLRILAFDSVTIAVLAFFEIWLFQPKLGQIGVDISYFGIVTAATALLQAIILNNFGVLEKLASSKKRFLLLSAVVPGIGYVILGLTNNAFFSMFLIVIIGGFGIPRYILFSNYMNKYIKSSNRATVLSAISMLRSVGMAVAYPLVGLAAEWSLDGTFIVIGALILLVAVISQVKEEHLID